MLTREECIKALRICKGVKGCVGCPLKGNADCKTLLDKSSYKHLSKIPKAMKFWSAIFNLNTGCDTHKYELIIAAPDFDTAKNQIREFDEQYCNCEDHVDFSTLYLHEITFDNPSVVRVFDRGVV